ncbi:MAG: MarR family transcriptional regulator [Thaumarchaeota archaeon]|nr:MAG: MarR family transcriptional regulator [Nitrososphaerota archaeon]TLY07251.1 MAG: MarR family transcriptional regulator [Nitrososphaerota archaeon]
MSQEIEVLSAQDTLLEGMLFVRITYILTTMMRAPIVAACFFLLALSSFVQYALSSPKVLDFTVYADGTAHVFYQTDVDPQSPDYTLTLYGNSVGNLVVEDENGTLLSSKVNNNLMVIETLGASTIKVDYDTPDLVSKSGKTWAFHVNSLVDYSVLLPKNTVIVGMSITPLNMQVVDDQSLIALPAGSADISYVFGVLGTSQTATLAIQKAHDFISTVNLQGVKTPMASAKLEEANSAFNQGKYADAEALANTAKNLALQEQQTANIPKNPSDNTIPILIAGGIAAAGAVTFFIKKSRTRTVTVAELPKSNYLPPDKETIFRLKPELRQEDKEIIIFISEKGGRVYESELRKKFLLPRTTTWRAVKRLEREGIVEIEKVDQQNLIKLRKIQEEEQE